MAAPAGQLRGGPPRASRSGDVLVTDVLLGIVAAVLAVGGMGVGVLSTDTPPTILSAPVLEPGEIAVAVQPVREGDVAAGPIDASPWDLPVGPPRTGIPKSGTGLPAAPVPPRPADAPPPVRAEALPKRPVGGIRGLPRLSSGVRPSLPALEDAGASEPGFGPGGPTIAPGTADPATSPDDPYAYVDPTTEDPGAPQGTGVVSDDEEGNGVAADPLAARAVAAYRQRLQHWLSRYFFVSGSGLSQETLRREKIRARLEIGDDRTVVGHAIEPGGHPELEAAARRALESVMGKTVPELPEHYPGPLQRWVSVTFVCTEETCD